MFSYAASTSIAAPAQSIWSLLTDAAAYPAWNPTVVRIEGDIAPGKTIKVFAAVSPGRAFPVKVSAFEPPHRMVWSGGMPFGLFKGVRTFSLTPKDRHVAFAMDEVFSGPLAGLIGKSMPDLQPAFDDFVAALKAEAERA